MQPDAMQHPHVLPTATCAPPWELKLVAIPGASILCISLPWKQSRQSTVESLCHAPFQFSSSPALSTFRDPSIVIRNAITFDQCDWIEVLPPPDRANIERFGTFGRSVLHHEAVTVLSRLGGCWTIGCLDRPLLHGMVVRHVLPLVH